MPKQRINREMVVDAAFSVARREGAAQVLVKRIAEELHCSVQPIYSYLSNMDELRSAVAEKAADHMRAYMAQHINPADPFRSTGYAYVRYAREEPHLFQMFVQRRREYVHTLDDLYGREADVRGLREGMAQSAMRIGQLESDLTAGAARHQQAQDDLARLYEEWEAAEAALQEEA